MFKETASEGNIECYFFLPNRNLEYYSGLKNALNVNPSDVLRNVWDKEIIGESISFNKALFEMPLEPNEVIFALHYIQDNLITYILLDEKIIVRISFKPWIDLSLLLKDLINYLSGHYTYLLIGFELDFDYKIFSFNDLLLSVKNHNSNTSFMLKEADNELQEYTSEWDVKGILEFLKTKTDKIINSID